LIDRYAVEPGFKRRATIELSDTGERLNVSFLDDFICIFMVTGDAKDQSIQTLDGTHVDFVLSRTLPATTPFDKFKFDHLNFDRDAIPTAPKPRLTAWPSYCRAWSVETVPMSPAEMGAGQSKNLRS